VRFSRDVVAGVALLLVCGTAFYATTTFREVPAMLSQNVPPTFFPRIVLAVLALLSLALLAFSRNKRDEPRAPLERPVYVTAGIFTVAVALVPYVGMLATVFLVSIGLSLYWGERSVIRIACLALGLPLAVYVVFVLALGMRFPSGVLW
jgi:NO-binding membrane sensor protein with MHYT domain